jgi:hypothetical protein
MAEVLTQAWLDDLVGAAADLPEVPGASGRVRYVIGDGKRDEQIYDVVFADGRLTEAVMEGAGEPDVVLTATKKILDAVATGKLDSQTALMDGKLKSSATGPILTLLPVLQSPEWRAVERTVAASTTT